MHLPRAVWTGIVVGLFIPLALFLVEYCFERKADYVTLTPFKKSRDPQDRSKIVECGEEVDFDPRHGHYLKVAELLVTLASASLIFIPNLRFPSSFPSLGFSLVLLGLTVVYALLFMAFLTYFYEMFLFDPRNFTAFRSSLVFALGFAACASFALAYIWLAVVVGTAIGNGRLTISGA